MSELHRDCANTFALLCVCVCAQLKVVKEGDSCDECVQRLLVEDRSPNGGASYADFLFHLHVNALRRVVE